MAFIDTQILIDALIGNSSNIIGGTTISSITANEFLGVHGPSPIKANYYVPLVPRGRIGLLHSQLGPRLHPRQNHSFNRMRTDRLVISFGNDFPSVVEYGSNAITDTINEKALMLFLNAICVLPKDRQKKLRQKFAFLMDNEVKCTAISPDTVTLAQRMLSEFLQMYQLKDNFRNSWNDFLVAATARRAGETLFTNDTLLFRFIVSRFGSLIRDENHQLEMSFPKEESQISKQCLESKGYINRGWDVKFRRGY